MRLVGVAVYEADGDGLDALFFEILDGPLYILAAEGGYDLAVVGDALRDLTAQVAGDEGRGLFKDHVEEVRPVASRELQHVAEALSGEQGGLCALALCEGVYDGGRAVEEGGYALGRDSALFQHVHDACLKVRRRGVGLFLDERAVLRDGHEVCEGASDVGCNSHLPVPSVSCFGVIHMLCIYIE